MQPAETNFRETANGRSPIPVINWFPKTRPAGGVTPGQRIFHSSQDYWWALLLQKIPFVSSNNLFFSLACANRQDWIHSLNQLSQLIQIKSRRYTDGWTDGRAISYCYPKKFINQRVECTWKIFKWDFSVSMSRAAGQLGLRLGFRLALFYDLMQFQREKKRSYPQAWRIILERINVRSNIIGRLFKYL